MARDEPRAADVLRRLLESGRGEETITFPGGSSFRVIRNPQAGVAARLSKVDDPSVTLTVFDAARERPDAFPIDVPFVPGVPTIITAVPGRADARSVQWWGVRDTTHFVHELIRQSGAQGWERMTDPQTTQGPFDITENRLRKGVVTRTIVSVITAEGALVTLADVQSQR